MPDTKAVPETKTGRATKPVAAAKADDAQAAVRADRKAERANIVCSFCLKPTGDVESMIAGPGVYICNECVDLCVQIIASKADSEPIPPNWEQRLSDDDLLAMLPKIAATGVQVDRQLDKYVRHARTRGITWTRIGLALGTTRQSAWERFSGEE